MDMHMAPRFCRKFRTLVVGALAISGLAASSALAGGITYPPCSVILNPVTNAATYTVSGSGLPPGMVVNVYIKDKISTWIIYGGSVPGGTVAANGTFSIGNIRSDIYYPSNLG